MATMKSLAEISLSANENCQSKQLVPASWQYWRARRSVASRQASLACRGMTWQSKRGKRRRREGERDSIVSAAAVRRKRGQLFCLKLESSEEKLLAISC